MITIDARLVNAGGIGTFLKAILEEGARRSHLKFCLMHWKKDETAILAYRPYRKIRLTSTIYSIKEQFELPLKIPSCSLFFSPHVNIPLFPIKAKRRLVAIHDVYHLAFSKNFSLFERMYAHMIYNAANIYSDRVATVSHFSFEEIHRYCKFPHASIAVIPLGARASFVPTPLNGKQKLPQSYLLAVGNLKPHKNITALVKAFAQLSLDEKLVLVGQPQKGTSLFEEIKQLKLEEKVVWLNQVTDEEMPVIYSNAKLLIFPSLYEGFGLPPIEAMACGCPVIASRNGSIPEICGDAVFYSESEALAKNIQLLLNDEKMMEDFKSKGFERAKLFSLEKSAERFVDLMETFLA